MFGNVVSLTACLLLGGCLLLFDATETTEGPKTGDFYISPDGSDDNDGRSVGSPLGTWAHALGLLRPGMTLVALDGVYNGSKSGYPNIDCANSLADSGESGKPITITARNQRQAWIQLIEPETELETEPEIALRVACPYWNIEDLRISGSPTAESTFALIEVISPFIQLRGLYLHDNSTSSGALVRVEDSNDVLIEGIEAYRFQGTALEIRDSNNIEIRMSYLNGASADSTTAIYFSKAHNSTVDNVIIEDVEDGVSVSPGSQSISISGSIVLNASDAAFGASSYCDCTDATCSCADDTITSDILFHNSVAVGCGIGASLKGVVNGSVRQFSSLETDWTGFRLELGTIGNQWIDGVAVRIANSLVTDSYRAVIVGDNSIPIHFDFLNIFEAREDMETLELQASRDISNTPNIEVTNLSRIDPELSNCHAYLRASSPMHANHIGANVIYQSTGGGANVLSEKVWAQDGTFPCGQQVSDPPKKNCHKLVSRLETRESSCPRP